MHANKDNHKPIKSRTHVSKTEYTNSNVNVVNMGLSEGHWTWPLDFWPCSLVAFQEFLIVCITVL